MKESKIENEVCKYAKGRGWLVYKFTSPNNKGVPDRIFLGPNARIIFVEFKAPSGRLTKLQSYVIDKIRAFLFEVYVIDNIEDGKKLFDEL